MGLDEAVDGEPIIALFDIRNRSMIPSVNKMKRRNGMADELCQIFRFGIKGLFLADEEGFRSVLGLVGEIEGGHLGWFGSVGG
jgi:hypothetical protein